MTQIGFPLDRAHEALDAFLTREGDGPDATRYVERWIGDYEGGKPLAYIVPAERMNKLENSHRQWLDSQEVHDDPDLPPGYRPWIYSPLAGTDRALPTEPLREPLAHFMHGKKWDELDQRQRDRVTVAAISLLLRVTLDPDGQGAVPLLVLGHNLDEPGRGLRWEIAYVTSVTGLFVRVVANGFFGEEWGILLGSGYRLPARWSTREDASTAAEALGRTLPNVDWMRLTPDGFTPKAIEAIKAVLERHASWGVNDRAEEPQVMADTLPADGEPADAAPAAGTEGDRR